LYSLLVLEVLALFKLWRVPRTSSPLALVCLSSKPRKSSLELVDEREIQNAQARICKEGSVKVKNERTFGSRAIHN
jgi:hypothetical protein